MVQQMEQNNRINGTTKWNNNEGQNMGQQLELELGLIIMDQMEH